MLRSAIIDSVYPPQVGFFSEYAVNAYNAFGRVFDACNTADDCRESYPDLEALLYQVMDRLNAQPQNMRHAGHTLYYDGYDLMDAFYLYPYAHQAGVLPAAIYATSQGDYSFAERLMPFTLNVLHQETIAEGVQNSILCREELPYESYDRLIELGQSIPSHFFESFNTDFYWRMCEIWGVDPADEFVNQAVVSDVPTLVLEGLFDPITPIEWGKLAAETLSHSYYYEFPGGHGIMRTYSCGLSIGLQFIDDPWTEPDATCILSMSPPDFQ